MNNKIKFFGISLFIVISNGTYSQSDKQVAMQKAQQAIKLEDEEGKYDEAIKLFKEAQKLDPQNINYPYELAYAYSGKKEYKKASDVLEKLLEHKDVYALIYQALGNAYDFQGEPKKAIETYELGLKKFPKSGGLYVELGNMQLVRKEYNGAINYYEKGIEADPNHSSNYYRATLIYCQSNEEVWGMVYGEIFMNLERNSKRTVEVSKLLFDTYKSEIKITSDTSYSVSFSKNATIEISDASELKDFKLPFGIGCYELNLMTALVDVKQIDINSLDKIRTSFLNNYYSSKSDVTYPNALFDYQKKIEKNGHLEAYNHWLLMQGDADGFTNWKNNNETKWSEFITWFNENPLELNDENKFYRDQY